MDFLLGVVAKYTESCSFDAQVRITAAVSELIAKHIPTL
jgi:hypothetical protein